MDRRDMLCHIPGIRCWQITTAGLSCATLLRRTHTGSLNWTAKILPRLCILGWARTEKKIKRRKNKRKKPLPPFSFERIMISNVILMSQWKTSLWVKFEKKAFFPGGFYFFFPFCLNMALKIQWGCSWVQGLQYMPGLTSPLLSPSLLLGYLLSDGNLLKVTLLTNWSKSASVRCPSKI